MNLKCMNLGKKAMLFLLCLAGVNLSMQAKNDYPYTFNPVKGLVDDTEKAFRQEICLNGKWCFMPVYGAKAADFKLPGDFKWDATPIKIPSPWNVNDFTNKQGGDFVAYPSYPKKWKDATIGWMKKDFEVSKEWAADKRIILHFEGLMGKAMIYVNEKLVAENFELFMPLEIDVTDLIKAGDKNEVLVGIAKPKIFEEKGKNGRRVNVGGSMWGTEMAGIWQDVYLFAYPQVYVQDMFVQPSVSKKTLAFELEINNTTAKKKTVTIDGIVKQWINTAGKSINEAPVQSGKLDEKVALAVVGQKKVVLNPNGVTKVRIEQPVADGQLNYWTPSTPHLYGALISIKDGKKAIDIKYERFGWREFDIEGGHLRLNGKNISLAGDSWHFTGVPQMTRRYAWAWYTALKAANCNAARLHAQPFPRFYMDMADEMGICILGETGLWSSDGGPKIDSEEYWTNAVEHIRRYIKRDRNHASIFGWSVCNEVLPVAIHVFKSPEELVQRQVDEINHWVRTAQEMDPTRGWISGDGETMRPTILPTVVGHYGDLNGMKNWASQGKPWGIGEQSMAYYGTPKQTSKYNGDRSYESQLGRMEGLAIECYDLLKTQHELNASYASVFNLVWYALQPLALGQKDTSVAPSANDGIFFTEFKEGGYGMQPERLGPYTTTLNPGYDPSLPLYITWPMFDAIRAANATPMQPYNAPAAPAKPALKPVASAEKVIVLAGEGSTLVTELTELGIVVAKDNTLAKGKTLIVVDGKNFPTDAKQLALLDKAKSGKNSMTVLIWGIVPANVDALNVYLPYKVNTDKRLATSFLVTPGTIAVQGMGHADFYFSELLPNNKNAMKFGLSGDFVDKGETVLKACPAEWTKWNYKSETTKTAAVFRSERETKGSPAAIVTAKNGETEFVISSLDLKDIKYETNVLVRNILSNLGASISNSNLSGMQAFDENATLHRALTCIATRGGERNVKFMLDKDFLNGEVLLEPGLDTNSDGIAWQLVTSSNQGKMTLENKESKKVAGIFYLSYWIYSPRSLVNLLAEPDMPHMDMIVDTPYGFRVWVNHELQSNNMPEEGVNTVKVENLKLNKGWNHVMMKVVVPAGNEKTMPLKVRLDSNDDKYLKQVLSSVVR